MTALLPSAGASRVAPVTIHKKARVYRLANTIAPGTILLPADSNECANMLEDARDDGTLPPSLALRYEAWREHTGAADAHLRRWAYAFIEAWEDGLLDLPASGLRGAVVRRGDYAAQNSREVGLSAVLLTRVRGVTVGEARALTGVPGNGISGTLSLLHRVGVLAVVDGERR